MNKKERVKSHLTNFFMQALRRKKKGRVVVTVEHINVCSVLQQVEHEVLAITKGQNNAVFMKSKYDLASFSPIHCKLITPNCHFLGFSKCV